MMQGDPQKTENKRTAEVAELPKPPPVHAWYGKYQQCWYCKKWDSAGGLDPGTDKWYCQPCWDWTKAYRLQQQAAAGYNAWVLQQQTIATPVPEPMEVDADGL